MKIILVNNFYYNRGGDCTYLFSLKELLERKGHKVIIFSMHHPQNFESRYSKYFVSYINYAEMAKNKNLSAGIKVMLRSIYSLEAKRKIRQLIANEKPDIAHLNNIRQHVTTSILPELKKERIPIVWTLHDYQLICPNISFLAHGSVCEKCKKRKYYWPIITRCKKNSLLASSMAAAEHSAQMLMGIYKLVDLFICPSNFLKDKFIEYGFDGNKLVTLNYFIEVNQKISNSFDNYIIYAGRLSEEKGLFTLVDAVRRISGCILKIVGDGPLRTELESYVRKMDVSQRIEFLGHRDHGEVMELIRKSKSLVIPSEWYENFPYVVLEALASGKPVIGSRTGGIPELVKDHENGFLFEPGNVSDLISKIETLPDDKNKILSMGMNGRSFVERNLNGEKHYEKLMDIYNMAFDKNELTLRR